MTAAENYIRSIRNPYKKAYAQAFLEWRIANPDHERADHSTIPAQDPRGHFDTFMVRMNILSLTRDQRL